MSEKKDKPKTISFAENGYNPKEITQTREYVPQKPTITEGYNPKGIVRARTTDTSKKAE